MLRSIPPLVVALALAGCALAPTHDSKISAPLAAASQGNVEEALRALDAKTDAKDKSDLLLNLERGELLRVDARYGESLASFEVADIKVNEWEATAKSAPEKLMGQLGATMFGETFRNFEGQDYEKVMLTTRMAMNRISLGDLDNARVDVKRTHEREAVIAEFRAKETATAEEEAKNNGITGEAKELNGYPIETLNDPEVLQLKNGYQNALSHYMAGFVYEALNEPGLAAPGYRKAIELRPGLPMLEEGLRGLDQRTSLARPKGFTDVLFVIEIGNAPARKSQRITFPIPSRKGLIVVPLAFPVIRPNPTPPMVDQISVGDKALQTALIADFNVMARRALKDELPGIQLRAAIRAIGKGAIQEGLNRQGALLGLFGNIAAVATESEADDRMWRSLPERVFVARSFIAPGDYTVRLPGLQDNQVKLTVEGRYMVVPIRMFETKTYFAQPTHFGTAGQMAAAEPPPPAAKAPAKAPAKTPAKTPAKASAKAPARPAAANASAAAPAKKASDTANPAAAQAAKAPAPGGSATAAKAAAPSAKKPAETAGAAGSNNAKASSASVADPGKGAKPNPPGGDATKAADSAKGPASDSKAPAKIPVAITQ